MKSDKITQCVAGIWGLFIQMPIWMVLLFIILWNIPSLPTVGWIFYAIYLLASVVGFSVSLLTGYIFGED